MIVRTYCRRSKNDEGKQQFSLDVQLKGCVEMIERMGYADESRVDYVDDGRAGDDFLTRSGLRQLIADAKRGDVILCRDQSRLGRDAIEVTLVIRDLVRDRGCLLYYYSTGQQVLFANAIDQATTFIQGTGHQMELEAIRSRTREALRDRVRHGRIAGGACYGYKLERKSDGSGRRFTVAVVDEQQAPIVERIYREYLTGRGLKAIAHQLNHDGVPAPSAGRRGSGSWASSAVRTILLNARYRGVYVHGRIKKVRQGGGSVRVKAEPNEVIVTDVPEWRIVDDATWFAVNEKFTTRDPHERSHRTARYPLTSIAKCGSCGGAVGATRVSSYGGPQTRVLCYGCARHHDRGSAVCPVTVHQPMLEVETALIDHLQQHVLSEGVLDMVLGEIRTELAAQMPKRDADAKAIERELANVRAEQKRLAKAVALADDVAELASELSKRNRMIANLEAQLLAAKRTPNEVASLVTQIEGVARERLREMRDALANRRDLRDLFLTLFPDGLTFTPTRTPDGARQVWRISGEANIGRVIAKGSPEHVTTRHLRRDAENDERANASARKARDGMISPEQVATPTGFERVSSGHW